MKTPKHTWLIFVAALMLAGILQAQVVGTGAPTGQPGSPAAASCFVPVIYVDRTTKQAYVCDPPNWLAINIKGDTGATGANGKNGIDGLPGKDGLPGANGKDGINGKDGKDGTQGDPGPAGPAGQDGSRAIKATPATRPPQRYGRETQVTQ